MSRQDRPSRSEGNHRCAGQVSFEFIIVLGASIALLIVLLTVTAYQLRTATTDATLAGMDDITQSVQLELLTARSVGDGYTRTFTLPERIQRRAYTLELENDGPEQSIVTLTTAGRNISVATPPCTGTLAPGTNTIVTNETGIWCNP